MDGKTSIKYLQEYIKSKDYNPELKKEYFLKLSEEVGELAKAIRKNNIREEKGSVKETIDEELWDIMYYAIAIANCYSIDLENVIKEKEDINNIKYHTNVKFESGR
jgi:NTP pyrophosphatase (non-canonical NTP hydrolase)